MPTASTETEKTILPAVSPLERIDDNYYFTPGFLVDSRTDPPGIYTDYFGIPVPDYDNVIGFGITEAPNYDEQETTSPAAIVVEKTDYGISYHISKMNGGGEQTGLESRKVTRNQNTISFNSLSVIDITKVHFGQLLEKDHRISRLGESIYKIAIPENNFELFVYMKHDKIAGIFKTGLFTKDYVRPGMRVAGWRTVQPQESPFDLSLNKKILVIQNDFVQYGISASLDGYPEDGTQRLLRMPMFEEARVSFDPPSVQDNGFVIGAMNSPETILALDHINGIPTGELERRLRHVPRNVLTNVLDMQSRTFSYLGPDERLKHNMIRVTDTVSAGGTTCQELAAALQYFVNLKSLCIFPEQAKQHGLFNNQQLAVAYTTWNAWAESPFETKHTGYDNRSMSDFEIHIEHLETGRRLEYCGITPWALHRYGIPLGVHIQSGMSYPVDISTAIDILGLHRNHTRRQTP